MPKQSREVFIAKSVSLFVNELQNEITLEQLEAFASNVEETAREKDAEMTRYLQEHHPEGLVHHAACMRTLGSKITLLRGGLIPALKMDSNNTQLRLQAIQAMGYIRANFEAMDCLLY